MRTKSRGKFPGDVDGPAFEVVRRNAIIVASADLVTARKDSAVHMREFAEASGVALATLYRYFPSKELLLVSIYGHWLNSYWDAAERSSALPGTGSNRDRLERITTHTFDAFRAEPYFWEILSTVNMSRDPDVMAALDAYDRSSRDYHLSLLHGLEPDDAQGVIDTLIACQFQELTLWFRGSKKSEEAVASVYRCVRLLLEFQDPTPAR